MVNTITLKALRPELPEVIKHIDTRLDRYIITKRGKPIAIMLSMDDYESLLETIEILSDKEAMRRIRQAKREFAEGKGIPFEEARRRIEKVDV